MKKEQLSITLDNIAEKYTKVYNSVYHIVKNEAQDKINNSLTYSHNNYFKNIKCKFDLDTAMRFVDYTDEELILDLK